jgi:translation initiation factor IF-3
MAYTEMGVELLKRVAEEVMDIGKIEKPPTQEARNRITMVIVPK